MGIELSASCRSISRCQTRGRVGSVKLPGPVRALDNRGPSHDQESGRRASILRSQRSMDTGGLVAVAAYERVPGFEVAAAAVSFSLMTGFVNRLGSEPLD